MYGWVDRWVVYLVYRKEEEEEEEEEEKGMGGWVGGWVKYLVDEDVGGLHVSVEDVVGV